MARNRRKTVIIALALFACADPTGLGTDGPLTWSALVDSARWAPDNGGYTFAFLTRTGYLLVAAIRKDTLGQAQDALGVQIVPYSGPGHYPLTPEPNGSTGLYSVFNPATQGVRSFVSASAHPGELWITEVDTLAHRIAGRFSFEAQEDTGTAHVNVSGGVFRVVYDTLVP